MKKNVIMSCLKMLSGILSMLAIYTVNSACVIVLGQDEEPESLNRFKKIK